MKVKNNVYDIIVEIICLTLLIGVVIYLISNWSNIPDKIPGHFNARGEVDRMGNKGELILLPIVSWLMYLGMTVLNKFPQALNTGVKVTEENKERVYRVLKYMLNTMKLLVVIVFVYLTIISSQALSLPLWFLPTLLILIFGSIILFTIKLNRVK